MTTDMPIPCDFLVLKRKSNKNFCVKFDIDFDEKDNEIWKPEIFDTWEVVCVAPNNSISFHKENLKIIKDNHLGYFKNDIDDFEILTFIQLNKNFKKKVIKYFYNSLDAYLKLWIKNLDNIIGT